MSLNALVAPLCHVPLFADLQPHQMMALVRAADRVVFQPGDTIIKHDKMGEAAFLIVQGEAVCLEPDAVDLEGEALEVHTLLGELAMLVETEYSTTVVAQTVVRTLKFTRAAIFELIEQDPEIAEHFISMLSGRLLSVADELRDLDQQLAEQSARLATLIPATQAAPH